MIRETPLKSKLHKPLRSTPDWFRCTRCGYPVSEDSFGTKHRNHCPFCLWSKHVDEVCGDRASDCGGAMEPISVWSRQGGDWAIIHQCRSCGKLSSNRIAGDDSELALMAIAVRALARPPFPVQRLAAIGEVSAPEETR